jgi:hypothetical protein
MWMAKEKDAQAEEQNQDDKQTKRQDIYDYLQPRTGGR